MFKEKDTNSGEDNLGEHQKTFNSSRERSPREERPRKNFLGQKAQDKTLQKWNFNYGRYEKKDEIRILQIYKKMVFTKEKNNSQFCLVF